MLTNKVAGQRLRQRFIQRFAAERRPQPQAVYQRRQPVARLLRLLARQLAAEFVHQVRQQATAADLL